MINIMITSLVLSLMTIMMFSVNLLISKKMLNNREKSSSYECGFDPLNSTTESFSIQFFLISIMFLTFDIEIVVMIPMIPSIKSKQSNWITTSATIMVILLMGLYAEWMENSIKWEK